MSHVHKESGNPPALDDEQDSADNDKRFDKLKNVRSTVCRGDGQEMALAEMDKRGWPVPFAVAC